MKQFEYKTVKINGRDTDEWNDMLNLYGKQGWELASSLSQPALGSSQYSLIGITQKYILIFKRQIDCREG